MLIGGANVSYTEPSVSKKDSPMRTRTRVAMFVLAIVVIGGLAIAASLYPLNPARSTKSPGFRAEAKILVFPAALREDYVTTSQALLQSSAILHVPPEGLRSKSY